MMYFDVPISGTGAMSVQNLGLGTDAQVAGAFVK